MTGDDFSIWYRAGAYGGLACALAAAAVIALIALRGRRGAPRRLAMAELACLAAVVLTLPAIWWNLNRLDVYGPLLAGGEVTFWLAWAAAAGWVVPLSALAGFWSFAGAPAPAAGASPLPRDSGVPLSSRNDPGRQIEPLGPGRAWGRLVAVDGPYAGRAFALTRQLTLLGREADNDIVLDSDQCSRDHAEIRLDHGHPQLADRRSTNGTRLNRQLVRNVLPLRAGDVIEMGGQSYRFEPLDGVRDVGELIPPPTATRKITAVPTIALAFEGDPLALITLSGSRAGARWLLQAGVTTVGRDSDRDICLPDLSVSRQHAEIVRQRAGYFVADLQSSNGTQLNGQPLTAPAMLSQGDVLRIGEIELRCETVAALTTPPPASPIPPRPTARPQGRSAVTTPPAGVLLPGVFSNSGAPVSRTRTRARLGPPRLTPSDPPARDQPPRH